MRRMIDQGPSLFDWAAAQVIEPAPVKRLARKQTKPADTKSDNETVPAVVPTVAADAVPPSASSAEAPRPHAQIVDFIERRETLPRFILCQPAPFAGLDREIARKEGRLQPAPILRLPNRHPASPGSYGNDPPRQVQR